MSSSEKPMNVPTTVSDPGERNAFDIGDQENTRNHNAGKFDREYNTAENPNTAHE